MENTKYVLEYALHGAGLCPAVIAGITFGILMIVPAKLTDSERFRVITFVGAELIFSPLSLCLAPITGGCGALIGLYKVYTNPRKSEKKVPSYFPDFRLNF